MIWRGSELRRKYNQDRNNYSVDYYYFKDIEWHRIFPSKNQTKKHCAECCKKQGQKERTPKGFITWVQSKIKFRSVPQISNKYRTLTAKWHLRNLWWEETAPPVNWKPTENKILYWRSHTTPSIKVLTADKGKQKAIKIYTYAHIIVHQKTQCLGNKAALQQTQTGHLSERLNRSLSFLYETEALRFNCKPL